MASPRDGILPDRALPSSVVRGEIDDLARYGMTILRPGFSDSPPRLSLRQLRRSAGWGNSPGRRAAA